MGDLFFFLKRALKCSLKSAKQQFSYFPLIAAPFRHAASEEYIPPPPSPPYKSAVIGTSGAHSGGGGAAPKARPPRREGGEGPSSHGVGGGREPSSKMPSPKAWGHEANRRVAPPPPLPRLSLLSCPGTGGLPQRVVVLQETPSAV